MHHGECVCVYVYDGYWIFLLTFMWRNAISQIKSTKPKCENKNFYHEIICFGFFHLLSNFFFSWMVADIVEKYHCSFSLIVTLKDERGGKKTDLREEKKTFSQKKVECTHKNPFMTMIKTTPVVRLVMKMALCYFVGRLNKQPTKNNKLIHFRIERFSRYGNNIHDTKTISKLMEFFRRSILSLRGAPIFSILLCDNF